MRPLAPAGGPTQISYSLSETTGPGSCYPPSPKPEVFMATNLRARTEKSAANASGNGRPDALAHVSSRCRFYRFASPPLPCFTGGTVDAMRYRTMFSVFQTPIGMIFFFSVGVSARYSLQESSERNDYNLNDWVVSPRADSPAALCPCAARTVLRLHALSLSEIPPDTMCGVLL